MKTDPDRSYNGRYIYMTKSRKELQSLALLCKEMGLSNYTRPHTHDPLGDYSYYTGILVDLNNLRYHIWVLDEARSATKVSYLKLILLLERKTNGS